MNSFSGEYSLVIGVVLDVDSEEGRSAVNFAVQDAIRGEDLEQSLDIFFIQDDVWLQNIKQIPGSLFYSK
jgi:sulfur relay (sulfurtransferase) complex TusBCD TusD component (DsrE family)